MTTGQLQPDGYRRSKWTALLGLAVMLGATPYAGAQTIYVDDDASANGSGLSWSSPLRHLQDALSLATNSGASEVRVAGGLYHADRSAASPTGSGDRAASFHLPNGVTVRGGYAGPQNANPDLRTPGTWPSTLSGDLLGNDHEFAFFNHQENSFHVVVSDGVSVGTEIDGFTITAGYAFIGDIQGAGLHNDGGNLTIRDCTFLGNNSFDSGGAIYNAGGLISVLNCEFRENGAASGAGIYNIGSDSLITECRFIDNKVTTSAGAAGISNIGNADPVITRCRFSGNIGARGGAIHNRQLSDPIIVGCTFSSNQALGEGGAIYSELVSSPTIVNCIFNGNTATGFGGAIVTWLSGSPQIVNCTFWSNTAADGGGALYARGIDANPTLSNSILWNNTPDQWMIEFDATIDRTNCNIMNATPNVDTGIISAAPEFTAPGLTDVAVFTLAEVSPCIDAGDTSRVPTTISTDADGQPRLVDDPKTVDTGTCGAESAKCIPVDMGAHEYQICLRGDVDCNGVVNSDDLVATLIAWGECGTTCAADFNGDGVVSVDDLIDVIVNWTTD